jgi:hypothetical protein
MKKNSVAYWMYFWMFISNPSMETLSALYMTADFVNRYKI